MTIRGQNKGLAENQVKIFLTLVLFKGLLLKRPWTIPLLKGPLMGSFKKASDEIF